MKTCVSDKSKYWQRFSCLPDDFVVSRWAEEGTCCSPPRCECKRAKSRDWAQLGRWSAPTRNTLQPNQVVFRADEAGTTAPFILLTKTSNIWDPVDWRTRWRGGRWARPGHLLVGWKFRVPESSGSPCQWPSSDLWSVVDGHFRPLNGPSRSRRRIPACRHWSSRTRPAQSCNHPTEWRRIEVHWRTDPDANWCRRWPRPPNCCDPPILRRWSTTTLRINFCLLNMQMNLKRVN